jgi:uncharacterized membrane protein YGL010W
MKTPTEWFDEYGDSHQHPVNKRIHWVCVPIIFITTVGLVWSIPAGPLKGLLEGSLSPYSNWATLASILAVIYYFALSSSIGLGMLVWCTFTLWLVAGLDQLGWAPLWATSLTVFVLAWIVQLVGHRIEGKKPSFFTDLQFLLIGPAWLLHFIYRRLGINYETQRHSTP